MILNEPTENQLQISVGQCTKSGVKLRNEDCIGFYEPDVMLSYTKGFTAVVADGVSAASRGQQAAEMCVHSFLSDYYSTPDSWSVKTSAQRVLTALNRWLYSQGHSEGLADEKGYLSTHSSIIIVSNTASIFHIGDSRVYRIRQGVIELLTQDHSTQISKKTNYLNRAMGLNLNPKVDYKEVGLQQGDTFLLTTDGVHGWLLDQYLMRLVHDGCALDSTAESIIDAALHSGSDDNLSALLVRIDALPSANHGELRRFLSERPFPPLLYPGVVIDGLEVIGVLFESARSQLYRVRDLSTSQCYVMKTPSPKFADDPEYIERFVSEEWIGRRVDHKNLVKVLEHSQKASFLYYLMEEIKGQTLAQWLEQSKGNVDILKIVQIISEIVDGVRVLHRKETIHQDLKLDNIILDDELRPVVIDYGSCRVASLHAGGPAMVGDEALGTLEFAAPEYRLEIKSDVGPRSDMFSIAMIAYYLMTCGQCPYGDAWLKAKTFKDFANLEYIPAYRHKPIVPVWVDGALRRALRVDAESRYSSMSEFVADLKKPNPLYRESRHLSLMERNPERFWQIVSLILFFALIFVLVT